MADMQVDMLMDSIVSRYYYCNLLKSFKTFFGGMRFHAPLLLTALCHIFLVFQLRGSRAFYHQVLIASMLILIGLPSIVVSISTTLRCCSGEFQQEDLYTIFATHWIMCFLFVSVISLQINLFNSFYSKIALD
jgi:hypothetical protein